MSMDTESINVERETIGPLRKKMTSNLLTLPNEIIDQIISLLDSAPPSLVKTNDRPDVTLTTSKDRCLKHLSRTSRKLRAVCITRLFRHTRVEVPQVMAFVSFLSESSLTGHVATVTVMLADPSTQTESVWWLRLLENIPLTVLTIHGAPHMFSDLAQTSIDDSHAWAFNMPFHTLTLTQDKEAVNEDTKYSSVPSLLTARRWKDLKYNEGSSIVAYATYVSQLHYSCGKISRCHPFRIDPHQLSPNVA